MTLVVFPGRDGESSWYEDDGLSFDYRNGAWMRVHATWHDAARRLALRLAPGSRALAPMPRTIMVRLAGSEVAQTIQFTGQPVEVKLA